MRIGQPANITFQTSISAGDPTFSSSRTAFATNIPGPPGVWTGRYGKPGPVVVVETPEAEAEIEESYPESGVKFIRRYEGEPSVIGSFPNVGKPAGLVQVYSPEGEEAVRWKYPASTIKFIRVYEGEQPLVGLGQEAPRKILIREDIILGGMVGATLGFIGFLNRKQAWGQMLLSTGSSMIGTSLVLLMRDLTYK